MTIAPAPSRGEALAERLFAATIEALELQSVYLGTELGLYRALAERGPSTPGELAEAAGIAPRYAREWLEQQAVAGFLDVDDAGAGPEDRRYGIDAEHARVLGDADAADHVAPFAHMIEGIARALPLVVEAYRTGGGVPYTAYGRDFRHGQGHINRPAFTHDLPESWLAAMPDVVDRLRAGGRVADVACGQGWSTIGLARAFPAADVIGLDLDSASIADARRHAAEAGLADRVRFADGDAAGEIAPYGPFDLVLVLEALHDMAQPVALLEAARRSLAPGGVLLVADEKVADAFTAPGDEAERLMYGFSVTHCLPSSMAEQPSAAIGTVIRADEVRRLAGAAGFGRVQELDADGGFFRLYRMDG